MLTLDNAYKNNVNMKKCILVRFPPEIQLAIVKDYNLDVADRACLALSCKTLALFFNSEPQLLTFKEKLQHGEEDVIRDMQIESDYPYLGDMSDGEAEKWSAEMVRLNHALRYHVNPMLVTNFMKRLSSGWNRSSARFCVKCKMFVSTDSSHWKARDAFYTYKSNSWVAQSWRKGRCTCDGHYYENGQHAREHVRKWIEEKKNSLNCPTCEVSGWSGCSCCNESCWEYRLECCPVCR